jgi:hypothetical protein
VSAEDLRPLIRHIDVVGTPRSDRLVVLFQTGAGPCCGDGSDPAHDLDLAGFGCLGEPSVVGLVGVGVRGGEGSTSGTWVELPEATTSRITIE